MCYNVLYKIVVTIISCLFIGTPVYCKGNDKFKKMWEQIELAASSDNQSEIFQKCIDLISAAPLDNEYSFRGRIMLCDYYLQKADMIGIYEQYAYLRAYQKQHKEAELCSEYMRDLRSAYDTLMMIDKRKEIQEGIYFSNAFNKSGIPILALEIKQVGNTYRAIIHPVCEFAKLMDMYKLNGTPSFKTNAQSDILFDGENNEYTAMWGSEKVHRANENAAKTWMEGGEQFRADMYGEMAKRDMSIGETVGATIGTEIGGALFDAISSLFASQKVTARTLGIKWIKEESGILKVHLNFFLETQKSGSYPKRKDLQYNMRLYKMYPHYELLFRNSNGLYLSYRDEQQNKKLEKTNVAFFDENLKRYWYDSSKHNKQMYKHFAANSLFKPYLGEAQKKMNVPIVDDLRVNYDDNNSLFYLAGWNKKIKSNDYFAAVLYDNGRITIGEMVNGRYNGKFMEFDNDGSCNDLTMVNGYMNGRCILRHPDGQIYFDGNYSDGEKEGYGVETYLDGIAYKGMWKNGKKNGEGIVIYPDNRSFSGEFNNDIPWKGIGTLKKDDCIYTGTLVDGFFTGECIIEYANGDIYKGQVEGDRPNGIGSITYADTSKKPRVLKTKWVDGSPEVTKQKTSPRKKKGVRK